MQCYACGVTIGPIEPSGMLRVPQGLRAAREYMICGACCKMLNDLIVRMRVGVQGCSR